MRSATRKAPEFGEQPEEPVAESSRPKVEPKKSDGANENTLHITSSGCRDAATMTTCVLRPTGLGEF